MNQPGVVAVAGGTGFTGRRVVARLADRGLDLRCLVRETSPTDVLPTSITTTVGDLDDLDSIDRLLEGARALVYTASMGFGHIPNVVAACERQGVRRAVFVSTTAIFTRLPAPSKVVRTAAEDAVRASALHWTIVRPTMIYGAPGDRNMERLLHALLKWPFLLIPGRGTSLVQPVHVDDLADGIAATLDCAAAIRQAYDLSGREPLSFDDAVLAAARAVGRPGRRLHVPLGPVVWTLGLVESLGLRLPVKREQVLRLAEDKAFSHAAAARDLGYAPRSFPEGIAAEAAALGLAPEPRR